MNRLLTLILVGLVTDQVVSFKIERGFWNITDSDSEDRGINWSYENKNDWPTVFAHYCRGNRQSPIDIIPQNTHLQWYFPWAPINFENYMLEPKTQTISNNGRTLKISFTTDTGKEYKISNGRLDWGKYILDSMHFHWGSTDTQGGEHTISGARSPLELQMVHYHEKYNSLNTALNFNKGIAVVGVLFEISPRDNSALAPLIAQINNILKPSSPTAPVTHTMSTRYAFSSLLPKSPNQWYFYEGSLTTPLCNEVVLWTIFREKLTISKSQLTEIRKLKDAADKLISNNYRNIQSLSNRIVQRSF